MNRRQIRPTALVDLKRVRGLDYLVRDGEGLRIGALTRHIDIENADDPQIRTAFGVLPESARLIGHLPIRTRGTFGGSIAYADPRAEWCLLAVLLDAEVVVVSEDGSRTVPAKDFFTGAHQSAARWDEIVAEVRFPHPAPNAALVEFGIQQGDLPVVAASAAVDLDARGRIASARIALGGVADRPVRANGAEKAAVGSVPDGRLLDHLAQLASKELDPPADPRTDGHDRKELATVLVARALRASIARGATAGTGATPRTGATPGTSATAGTGRQADHQEAEDR
jgi:carbon-monoxide dehydrogenase medium subunit